MVDCFRSGEETMKFIRFLFLNLIRSVLFEIMNLVKSTVNYKSFLVNFLIFIMFSFFNLDLNFKNNNQISIGNIFVAASTTIDEYATGTMGTEVNHQTMLRPNSALAATNGTCLDELSAGGSLEKYAQEELSMCVSLESKATWACMGLENWGMATGAINGILPMIKGAKSQGDACKANSKALDIAEKAFTTYNVTCGSVKFLCENRCKAALAKLDSIIADEEKLKAALTAENGAIAQFCAGNPGCAKAKLQECTNAGKALETAKGTIAKAKATVSVDLNKCEGYGIQLMGSAVSLLSTLQKKNNDAQCACVLNPDTKDCQCQKDPTLEICQQALDCNDPKNTANVTCICQKNNKIAGCPSTDNSTKPLQATRQQSNQARFGGDDSSNTNPNIGGGNGALPESNYAGNNAGGGSNALGSGGGGGSSSLGGSGGGSGGAGNGKNEKDKKGSGLNANIIGGYEGGGGGFGNGGGYGRFGDDENSKIDPALEAKARAAARGLASQQGAGVTGSGGKDNFQKVRENYQSQKQSLLNR